jgi:peptidyl-tRNA hydrolase, PTH2 family
MASFLNNLVDTTDMNVWSGVLGGMCVGIALTLGYKELYLFEKPKDLPTKKKGLEEDDDVDGDDSSDDSSDDEDSLTSSDVKDDSGIFDNLKMVLCIRTDLKMGKGKIVAQACHAATGAIKTAEKLTPKLCAKFWRSGSAKIALKCPSEEVMMNINAAARELKLVTYVVRDAGRTQIAPGSKTVCAIGPAPVNEIDKITGRNGIFPLKLM